MTREEIEKRANYALTNAEGKHPVYKWVSVFSRNDGGCFETAYPSFETAVKMLVNEYEHLTEKEKSNYVVALEYRPCNPGDDSKNNTCFEDEEGYLVQDCDYLELAEVMEYYNS